MVVGNAGCPCVLLNMIILFVSLMNNLSDLSEIKFLEFGPIDSYNLYRDGELIEIME